MDDTDLIESQLLSFSLFQAAGRKLTLSRRRWKELPGTPIRKKKKGRIDDALSVRVVGMETNMDA